MPSIYTDNNVDLLNANVSISLSQAEQLDQHKTSGVTYRAGERKQKPRKAPQLTTDMFNFSSAK